MNVPKLRFPEFRDAGEWEKSELGNLGELVSGLTYSPEDIREKGLSSNIQNGEICLEDNVYVTSKIKGASLSKPNDILICVRNGSKSLIGKNALVPEGMPLCTHGAFMTVFRSQSAKFVFQLFQTSDYQKQVDADLGATINSINGSHFIKYKFYIPLPQEQQKIADCLSSIDDLITAQTQKLDTLKVHKKGLMQQLFPAEGETLPKRRFPEFRGAGEWEENLLQEYFTHIRNGFVGTATPYYVSNGIPYLQGKNIKQAKIDANELVTVSNEFHRKQTKSQLCINDILMVQSGHVGECALVDQRFAGGNCHALIVMSPNKNTHSAFFVYYFYSQQGKGKISRVKTGNTIEHILASDLKALKMYLPSFKEQQKIADCLSSIDSLIAAQTQKIATLKLHKKGLMQQLFPALDEVKA